MITMKRIKAFFDRMFAVYEQNYREALKCGQVPTMFLPHTNGLYS